MKPYRSLLGFAILFLLTGDPARSQTIMSRQGALSVDYLQIKEGLNHGLVFRGPGLRYFHTVQWARDRSLTQYDFQGGLTYLESRNIAALSFHLSPLSFSHLFSAGASQKVYFGPFVTAGYSYQLYPDLQSGYSFWLTHYSLGVETRYAFSVGQMPVTLRLRTTAMGFTSRPPLDRDPYFFDLSLGYVMEFLHSDLEFGSWDLYNVSDVEITWHPGSSRFAVSYLLQYTGYYQDPDFTMVSQQIKVSFPPKIKTR